ncbi:MAG: hypothetical protein ACI9B9_000505 [Halioglobus sp.]|jgi:hypothetical protein
MIERNLGNLERLIRVAIGLGLCGWLAVQPSVSGFDWLIAAASLLLLLNGVFSRCYIWYVLDLDTSRDCENP